MRGAVLVLLAIGAAAGAAPPPTARRALRPAPVPLLRRAPARLPIDRAAHALFSGAVDGVLQRLLGEIERGGTRLLEPVDMGPLPKDPFLRAVATQIARRMEPTVHAGVVAGAVSDLLVVKDGVVDRAAVVRQYGPRAGALLDALERAEPRPGAALTDRRIATFAGRALRASLSRLQRPSAPVMRSFEALVAARAPRRPLEGFRVIGVQHLLGSTGGLARALAASGIAPEAISFMGKGYSQHPAVVDELTAEGFRISSVPFMNLSDGRAAMITDPMLEGYLAHELSLAGPDAKFLVIDDGGRLIKLIHERHPELASRCVGVEQTRKGIFELERVALKMPVINVAESWAKLKLESPMIGRSVAISIDRKVGALAAAGADPGRDVVLLGYGAVGREVAATLRARGYRVSVFDPKPDAQARAARDGLRRHATLDAALAEGHLVVSATGTTTIGPHNVDRLPDGAVLINTASGDSEIAPELMAYRSGSGTFHGSELRGRFRGVDLALGHTTDPARMDELLRTPGGRDVLVVGGGNVINFTGEVDPIPPRYIQLTRGLLYLGAIEAARATRPGLRALSVAPQRRFAAAVESELREGGGSLSHPDF